MSWIPAKQKNVSTKGNYGESVALSYLRKKGLTPIIENYHCRYGEVDLIMQDGSELVFVEVKYRSSEETCSAVENVGHTKQNKLVLTAEHFISTHPQFQDHVARIDVVGISVCQRTHKEIIEWLQNAVTPY